MAYDENLANRMRELLGGAPDLTEKRMFGGLAFLVNGNMAISANSHGGVMVRVDPAESEALVASSPAGVVEMRGRPMAGWLAIAAEHVRTKRELAKWVKLGTTYARSLPAKESKQPSAPR